jgi:hypothetical protein
MNISELLSAAILAATPFSVSVATVIAWVRNAKPDLMQGNVIRVVSIALGAAMGFAGQLSGSVIPEPYNMFGAFGGLVLGAVAGFIASGGKDLLDSVASRANLKSDAPKSVRIEDIGDPGNLSGPVWDAAGAAAGLLG